MSEIKFFGEVDIHPTKKIINSEYPAWYFDRQFESLGEEVASGERQLAQGKIPKDREADFRDRLNKRKERYEQIMSSMPKIDGAEKDRLAKARKEMAAQIRAGYYTRSQMMKGTVDAHKEAERMVKPMIEVKPEFVDILRAANVPIVDGKCTRTGMEKAWKIVGKLINRHGGDEETNTEVLRKD